MKRNSSQINPEQPPTKPPSFPRGFHGFRSSTTRFIAAGSQETCDINRTKRVRFADIDNDNDKLPESSERNHASRYDDPKTSEYAFFKKLKEDAGHRFRSHALYQDKSQSNNFHSRTDHSKERNNIVKNSNQQFRSSSSIENVAPDHFVSFHSPFCNASKKPEVDMNIAGTTLEDMHILQKDKKEYDTAFGTVGDQYRHGELFSGKRQKLRQWVADTSFPEIDELCSKGYDIVSVLLSQLFPQSKEDKCFKALKTRKMKTDTKSNLLTSPEPDVHFKKLCHMSTRNLLELECGPPLDFDSSSCWLETPRDGKLLNSNTPACRSHKTYFDNRKRGLEYEFIEKTTPISFIDDESTFGFHGENHESLTLNDVRELDEYHYPNESLHRSKPQALLLAWDFGNMTDERKFSIACHNTGLSVYPVLSSSWDDDQKQNMENSSVSGVCTPSLPSYHTPTLPSLWCSPSASYGSHNFEEQSLEVKNDIFAVLNKFSLPLSGIANHLNLAEDSNCDCKGGSNFLSPQNHLWFMSKIVHEEHHHPCKEAVFSFGVDFDLGQKFLPLNGSLSDHYPSTYALEFPQNKTVPSNFLTKEEYENCQDGLRHRGVNHFHEDMVINNFPKDTVNIHDWSSYFQGSVGVKKTCPLLLDKSHWDGYEGETFSADREAKYF